MRTGGESSPNRASTTSRLMKRAHLLRFLNLRRSTYATKYASASQVSEPCIWTLLINLEIDSRNEGPMP